MKSGWVVDLRGDSFDLQELRNITFPETTELEVESEKYYIRMNAEPAGADPWEVFGRAEEAMKLVNGAAHLYVEKWKRVTCGGPIYINEEGRRNVFALMQPGEFRIRGGTMVGSVHPASAPPPPPPPPPSAKAVTTASHDAAVKKVLRIFGTAALDFRDLYVIYEVVEADVGGLAHLTATGWVSKAEVRRFKHTANSVAALGDNSRHGAEATDPPPTPMSVGDARKLISGLVRRWIEAKP